VTPGGPSGKLASVNHVGNTSSPRVIVASPALMRKAVGLSQAASLSQTTVHTHRFGLEVPNVPDSAFETRRDLGEVSRLRWSTVEVRRTELYMPATLRSSARFRGFSDGLGSSMLTGRVDMEM
jgi:hypothetical protein